MISRTAYPRIPHNRVAAPKQRERQRVVIEGDAEEQIAAFVENLRKINNYQGCCEQIFPVSGYSAIPPSSARTDEWRAGCMW